eukprot:3225062-Rhodomonas_salina.2
MAHLVFEVVVGAAVGHVAGEVIGAAITSSSYSSPYRIRGMSQMEVEAREEIQRYNWSAHRSHVPSRVEEENADRSVLDVFPESGVECKLCMNTTHRDQLS